jgi:hypothetical protein
LADEFSSDHFQIINDVARANSGLSTDKLITKFVKEVNKKLDADYSVEDFTKQDNFIKTVDDLRAVIKETADAYPITPYIDSKAIAVLKKSLNEYNQIVPKVNELSQKELKLQDEIKATGLDLNSPSLQDSLDELSEIRKERTDLIPSDVVNKFDGFTLNKSDLEDATGKDLLNLLTKVWMKYFMIRSH